MIKSFANNKGIKYLFVSTPDGSIQHQVYMGCLVFKSLDCEQSEKDNDSSGLVYKDGAINIKCEAKCIGVSQNILLSEWNEIFHTEDSQYSWIAFLIELGFNSVNDIAVLEVKG